MWDAHLFCGGEAQSRPTHIVDGAVLSGERVAEDPVNTEIRAQAHHRELALAVPQHDVKPTRQTVRPAGDVEGE